MSFPNPCDYCRHYERCSDGTPYCARFNLLRRYPSPPCGDYIDTRIKPERRNELHNAPADTED